MKKYNLLFLVVTVFLCSRINAQSYHRFLTNPGDTNFFQIASHFYDGYEGSGQDTGEGSAWAQFRLWERHWAPRLAPTGSFKVAGRAMQEFVDNYTPSGKISPLVSSSWTELGPFTAIANGSAGAALGVGRVTAIAFDPNYNGTTNQILYAGGANGGVWRLDLNDPSPASWYNLNTDQQLARLSISSIAVDPVPVSAIKYIYAATGSIDDGFLSNGVYRSKDDGLTWQIMNTNLPNPAATPYVTGKLLIEPGSTSNVMYLATSDGLFKTSNRRAASPTWAKIYPTTGSELVGNVIFDPSDPTNQTLYAAGVDILKSTNGGISWSHIATGNGLNLSGTPLLTNPPFINSSPEYAWRINIGISADGTYLYAAIVTGKCNYVNWNTTACPLYNYFFQCTLSNLQWTQRSDYYSQAPQYGGPTPNRMAYQISPNPLFNQKIYTGDVKGIKSDDGGLNWIESFMKCSNDPYHDDIHALEFPPNDAKGKALFLGCDGGVWKLDLNTTTGNVQSCTALNNGLGISTMFFSASSTFDPHQVIAGMQDLGSNYLQNGNWTYQKGGDGFECAIDPADPKVMYLTQAPNSGNGRLHKSTTSVTNPSFTGIAIHNSSEDSYFGAGLAIDPSDHNTIYQARMNLWKSTSGSATQFNSWTKKSDFVAMYTPSGNVSAMYKVAVAPSDPNTIYGVFSFDSNNPNSFNGKIAKTNVGGCTGPCAGSEWVDISPTATNPANNPMGHPITGVAVSSTDANHLWITYSGYDATHVAKVHESTNAGISWTSVPWVYHNNGHPLPDVPINCIVYENGSNDGIYIGTDIGVFYKNKTMNGWEPFMTGLPNVIVSDLEINYGSILSNPPVGNVIHAATFGRGVWESPLACPQNSLALTGGLADFYEAKQVTISGASIASNNNLTVRGATSILISALPQGNSIFTPSVGKKARFFIHGCDQPGNSFRSQNPRGDVNSYFTPFTDEGENNKKEVYESKKIKYTLYPNPFSDHLHVDFSLPEAADVKMTVFTPYGQIVETIANSRYDKGEHTLLLENSLLAPGVYFVKLDLGDQHFTKAVIKK